MIDKKLIFGIKNDNEFNNIALQVYNFQLENCNIYQQFVSLLKPKKFKPKNYTEIPFLPIEFFKKHIVLHKDYSPELYFQSSGTTNQSLSKHYVADISWYEESYRRGFEYFFGKVSDYCILALLPSYSENSHSSLINMVLGLMQKSAHAENNFFLYNHDDLALTLQKLKKTNQKTIVLGVSFSLLDFAKNKPPSFENLIYIETGGMKGRKEELSKIELLSILKNKLNTNNVFSEYGMTEIFSQAYSVKDNIYTHAYWMKILIRDDDDPLSLVKENITGGINIIDLANINSCSFIATQDLGRKIAPDSFEILGRIDNSDVRGCSQLII